MVNGIIPYNKWQLYHEKIDSNDGLVIKSPCFWILLLVFFCVLSGQASYT